MDSGAITAFFTGVSAVIGAFALLLRQQRINDRSTRRELQHLRRVSETQARIIHHLRFVLAEAGLEAGPVVTSLDTELDTLRDQMDAGEGKEE